MYLSIEVSLDWCYNKIASRYKVTWNRCHIISPKLALVNGNLPQLSLRDGGWQQQQKCGFKSDFVLFQSSLQTTYFGQLQANSPGVEFLRTISRFRKRKKILSWPFYILCKTESQAFSCRCCAVMAKKCIKNCVAHAMLFFCLLNLLML